MGDLNKFFNIILKREKTPRWPLITYIRDYGLDIEKQNRYYAPFKYYTFTYELDTGTIQLRLDGSGNPVNIEFY